MELVIIEDVWVCPFSPLLEPGMGLQPTFAGAEEWQAPAHQTNSCRRDRGIQTYDAGGASRFVILLQPEVRAHVLGYGQGLVCGNRWAYLLI